MRRLPTLLGMLFLGVAVWRGVWAAPTVTMTSPPPNATISAALTPKVLLQATVTDPDEAIAMVTFYICVSNGASCDGGAGEAEVYSPPYQFQWTPSGASQSGGTISYLVWAQSYNVLAQSGQSTPIPFTVIQTPTGPSVTLVVPNIESAFVAPTAPVLYATASPASTVPPSNVVRVDFLDWGSVIGIVATPNSLPSGYAFVWQGAPVGAHLVTARATDTLGDSRTSSPITVNVISADSPPQLTLSAPITGQIFAPSIALPLAATATSALATIQRVEFSAGGMVVATVLNAPYATNWLNPLPGSFAIVATAYDDKGVAATSPAAYVKVLATPRSPSVVLTAPAPGATVPSSAPLLLAASALAPDGSIGRVDFYAGTTLLGSSATAPFQFSWANPTVGAQSLTAKAYDSQGRVGVSAAVAVTVAGTPPPTVALTAPLNNSTYPAATTILLSATATAHSVGGSISRVDFYRGGTTLIGSATASPYTFSWVSVPAGSYVLTAKATDNLGTSAISSPVNVTVTSASPSVNLTAPQNGAQYAQGLPIVLTAGAATPSRTIDRVEFYADSTLLQAVSVPGGLATATVNFTWGSAGVGAHVLSAEVFATDGTNAASSTVNISVRDLSVALTEPFVGQAYQSPAQIRITANPTETGGTIAQVDFYGDGVLIGTSTVAPYTFLWNGAAAGSHTISARARDAAGLLASSASLVVSVIAAPAIIVDAGIDGAVVADDNASISGTLQAPSNAALMINGQAAALDPNGHFFVDNFLLAPGNNTLTLILNTQDSGPITRTITINRNGIAPFEVDLDQTDGLAPLTTNLTIKNRGGVPFQRIEITTRSDGVPELTLTSLPNGQATRTYTLASAGVYTFHVKVFDASNSVTYTAQRRVIVRNPLDMVSMAAYIYNNMLDRLKAGDSSNALNAVSVGMRDKYSPVFATLLSRMPTIADQLRFIQGATVTFDLIEFRVARTTATGPRTFPVYFIRSEDGVWRIDGM